MPDHFAGDVDFVSGHEIGRCESDRSSASPCKQAASASIETEGRDAWSGKLRDDQLRAMAV